VEQVLAMLKKPCWKLTCPLPPHAVQVTGEVPALAPEPRQSSQSKVLGTCTTLIKDLAEQVLKVRAEPGLPVSAPRPPRAARPPGAYTAEAVVLRPFGLVLQDLVGLVHMLELLLVLLIPLVLVRVILMGELPVGLLYLLIGRVPIDPEYLVKICLLHYVRNFSLIRK
jgi:hypothetical protein